MIKLTTNYPIHISLAADNLAYRGSVSTGNCKEENSLKPSQDLNLYLDRNIKNTEYRSKVSTNKCRDSIMR